MDAVALAKSLNDAGLLAVMLVALIIVWRELKASHQEHINDLRQIAGLRQSQQPTHLDSSPPDTTATAPAAPDAI